MRETPPNNTENQENQEVLDEKVKYFWRIVKDELNEETLKKVAHNYPELRDEIDEMLEGEEAE